MDTFPRIKSKILYNEPLSKHTTFRIGGPCEIWAEPHNEEDLKGILKFADSNKKKTFIVGMGSNILFRDRGLSGIALHLGGGYFKNTRVSGTSVIAGAGMRLSRLINLTCKNGLGGMEGLVGIPGTVGGAIFMNSGYKGNISDCLEWVRTMDRRDGSIRIIKRKNLAFGYRHSNLDRNIILEARFRLKKGDKRKLSERKNELLKAKQREQPLASFSAGCIFRNPEGRISAARLIDMSRLKGKRIGGAEISKKHANFIVNDKKAKSKDVLRLISLVKRRVKKHFMIELVPEIIIV